MADMGWRLITEEDCDGLDRIVWAVCETTGIGWATIAAFDSRKRWISRDDGLVSPTHTFALEDLPDPPNTSPKGSTDE